jgi:hypothetical protein
MSMLGKELEIVTILLKRHYRMAPAGGSNGSDTDQMKNRQRRIFALAGPKMPPIPAYQLASIASLTGALAGDFAPSQLLAASVKTAAGYLRDEPLHMLQF